MRQISVKQFLQSRPLCSVPLGYEFKRWFAAPLTKRQNDIITLLEYHRVEKRRAPYLIIHDPHSRQDIHQIIRAYLQWRNEQTAPGLRAALVTPKRLIMKKVVGTCLRHVFPGKPADKVIPIKNFTARTYRAAHGQTFGMVAALNCHMYAPCRKPEDGFADFPSVFISMIDRTSPHHLLILHGCIPQITKRRPRPHSFGTFMRRAAANTASPYIIYDALSRNIFIDREVDSMFVVQLPKRTIFQCKKNGILKIVCKFGKH